MHEVFRHRFLRNFEPPTSYEEFEAAFIPLIDEQKKQALITAYDKNYGDCAYKDEINSLTNIVVLITSINHEYAKSDEQK